MNENNIELHKLNRLFHASSRVSQALVQAQSRQEVAPQICQRLVTDGAFALAWMGWQEAKGAPVVPAASAGAAPLDSAQAKSLAANLAAVIGHGSKTVVWNDPAALGKTHPAPPAGFRSGAAFAIDCGAGQRGVVAVYSRELNFFNGQEISILEDVAASISAGFDHLAKEAAQKMELGHERSLLRALMDNSADLIYFKDLNSKFIRCSKAMHERFNTTPQSVVGKSDFDFYGEQHAREAFADEQKIIQTGRPLDGKVERETWKKGHDSWVLTTKMPLHDDDGAIIGTVGISKDFTAIKLAEAKLEEMHKQLVEASRMAGMAEVATSILHNVGNVLNSVNVSSSVVCERVRNSRIGNVGKLAALLQENAGDLPAFFSGPKGRQLPAYLSDLAGHLETERGEILRELQSLTANIEHIKEIVAAQQSYARTSGVVELIDLPDLVDDALDMHKDAMGRHEVDVIREYGEVPQIMVDKHKVLQILVNLIHNSKYAVGDNLPQDKKVVLRVEKSSNGMVNVSVIDNGIGIAPENLSRIFEHGFTTRKGGHGFGLHSGALTARELGGSLAARSDGPGKGATFTLELPVEPKSAPV